MQAAGIARPAARRAGVAAPALFSVVVVVVLAAGERDAGSLPFTIAVSSVLVSAALLLSRRPLFSLVATAFVLAVSATASLLKYKHMAMNAQLADLYFYLDRPDTLAFLADQFAAVVAVAAGLLVLGAAAAALVLRHERALPVPRLRLAGLLAIGVAVAGVSRPHEASSHDYYVKKSHFISSLFASAPDAWRATQESALKQRLARLDPSDRGPAGAPVDEPCLRSGTRPHIVVALQESAVAPVHFPEWRASEALQTGFQAFDGKTHRLRVETYGGATWISTVQMLAGLSLADLDWRRPYATLLLQGRVRHSLTQHLKSCGYRTVAISPLTYNFVNEGPFLASIGVDEVLDYRAIGAATKHERDEVYYAAALDALRRHSRAGTEPVFIFVMTMAAHSPYDYRYEPTLTVEGEPFGNAPEVDEYLRRLALSRSAFERFLGDLARADDGRGFVVAEFGDHQPIVTRPLLEAQSGPQALSNFRSRAYETYYAVKTIGRTAAAPLPAHDTLDLTYLGVTVLEAAGLPLGRTYGELRELRDRCGGAFHACPHRSEVDRYLHRLTTAGLLDLP